MAPEIPTRVGMDRECRVATRGVGEIPTRVGMDRMLDEQKAPSGRSPRAWGWTVRSGQAQASSCRSPRAWGWTEAGIPPLFRDSEIPTRVGMDRGTKWSIRRIR